MILFCTALSGRHFRAFLIAGTTAAAGAQMIAASFHVLMLLDDIWRSWLFFVHAGR